jgi:hypothetical protein
MADAHAVTVDGPTDLSADELAERKRLAAVDYHTRELELLKDSLKRLQDRGADKDKVANQRQMIADEQAALAAVKGA